MDPQKEKEVYLDELREARLARDVLDVVYRVACAASRADYAAASHQTRHDYRIADEMDDVADRVVRAAVKRLEELRGAR